MPAGYVLRNVRPLGAPPSDVVIRNGVVEHIGPDVGAPVTDLEIIEGNGQLLFPGLIDAHTHMDKTLVGLPWHRNEHGPTLLDQIENERRVRREENIDFHRQTMIHARLAIGVGTTHIRSFVDIDTEIGLSAFEGLQRTKEAVKDDLSIQIVAFPQSGMLIRPGTVELMDEALRNGAEVVGGIDPCSMDRDPAKHLDTIFALAQKYDVDVDVHVHEPGEMGAFSIDLIAERTRVLGYQGRVVISHAFALGGIDDDRLASLIDLILENDIKVMSHGPGGHRPAPNLKKLRAAGVHLCAGNDGIQDSWNPLQRPDMLERAYIMCYRNNLRRDDDIENVLETITYGNAAVVGADSYGLQRGKSADLVVVDGETHVEAMVARRPRTLVMKAGRITARNGEPVIPAVE